MSKKNYFVVTRWMASDLNLSGNDLLVYALIYGFSQDGQSRFFGSAQYIADSIGASRRTIMSVLQSLTERGLLRKEEEYSNGVKNCFYMACTDCTGYEETAQGDMKELHRGYEKSAHNIKSYTKEEDIKDTIAQAFEAFWKSYPRKKSKGQAEKAWLKVNPSLYPTLMTSLEKQKQSADWLKEGGQFIPYPATWLNAKGWEDEIDSKKSKPKMGDADYYANDSQW